VGSVQQLRRLQDHLDDVLVAVPASAASGVWMKKEDIHFSCDYLEKFLALNFCR
jgi:hypothetical protein